MGPELRSARHGGEIPGIFVPYFAENWAVESPCVQSSHTRGREVVPGKLSRHDGAVPGAARPRRRRADAAAKRELRYRQADTPRNVSAGRRDLRQITGSFSRPTGPNLGRTACGHFEVL